MAKRIRYGSITPELLPIPDQSKIRDIRTRYATSDGWSRTELPPSFYDELQDLCYRYGGLDVDGDARLDVVVVDRAYDQYFHYHPIPSEYRPNPDLNRIFMFLKMNLSIAVNELDRFTQFRTVIDKEKSDAK